MDFRITNSVSQKLDSARREAARARAEFFGAILILSLTALNRFEAMKRESSSAKASVEAWCRRMAAASFWLPSALARRSASCWEADGNTTSAM
jgi:hypothetical protein